MEAKKHEEEEEVRRDEVKNEKGERRRDRDEGEGRDAIGMSR